MEDLIKKLTETAGITEEQAAKAVATVVDFIKEKFPPMMHGVVVNFINSGTDATDDGIL